MDVRVDAMETMGSIPKFLTGVLAAIPAPLRRRATQQPPRPTPPPAPIESPPITAADSDALGRGVPEHWPPCYNVCSDPCDMTDGPCACGAWHNHGELWVRDGVEWFGVRPAASG